MNKTDYLLLLSQQIRNKRARKAIENEMGAHIDDQIQDFMSNGMTREEAEQAAVMDMGDPIEAGVDLDMVHKPKMNWLFYGVVVAITLFSMGISWYLNSSVQHIMFLLLGIGCMTIICYIDYTFLVKYTKWICGIFLLFFVVQIFALGASVNGVMYASVGVCWISLWSLMYLYVPIYGAILYNNRHGKYSSLLKCIIFILIPIGLSVSISSVSLGVNMLLILLIMLSIAVYQDWFQVKKVRCLVVIWGSALLAPCIGIGGLYITGNLSGYQVEMLHHISEYVRLSHQNALERSGTGRPYFTTYTDYLIAYLIQYVSVGVGVVLLLILAMLIMKIYQIAIFLPNQFGKMIGIGCALVFTVQCVQYTLMNFYLIPRTAVYLPLFSNGGGATMVSYIFLGLILSIYRYQSIPYPEINRKVKR